MLNQDAHNDSEKLRSLKKKIAYMTQRTTANGCSEAEAMEAAKKVELLMAEYDLTEAEIHEAAAEKRAMCVTGDYRLNTKHHPFTTQVLIGLEKFLKIKCWRSFYATPNGSYARVVFFGPEVDVELAKYLFGVCHVGIETEWARYNGMKGGRSQRQSFYVGAASMINKRLIEMAQKSVVTGTALMVLKDQLVTQEFAALNLNMKTTKRSVQGGYDMDAYGAGVQAGKRVQLQKEVQ